MSFRIPSAFYSQMSPGYSILQISGFSGFLFEIGTLGRWSQLVTRRKFRTFREWDISIVNLGCRWYLVWFGSAPRFRALRNKKSTLSIGACWGGRPSGICTRSEKLSDSRPLIEIAGFLQATTESYLFFWTGLYMANLCCSFYRIFNNVVPAWI